MSKKKPAVALRKPPTDPAAAAAAEAFVTGAPVTAHRGGLDAPIVPTPAHRGGLDAPIVAKVAKKMRGGPRVPGAGDYINVYVPIALKTAFKVRAAERQTKLSDAAIEAFEAWLVATAPKGKK